MSFEKSKQYDLIKTITTVLVVIAHATRMYTGQGVITPTNPSDFLSYITKLVYSFHMPLFMCTSGMVYGMCIDDLEKYNDRKEFIINKSIRLLIPYYVIGFLVVAPVMTILDFTNDSYIRYVILGIGTVTNSRHLWYIFVLYLIFLICAFCKKTLQTTKPLFILPILLICSFCSQYVTGRFQLNMLLYYSIFFYLGYLINKNYQNLVRCCRNPLIILGSGIILAILCTNNVWIIKVVIALFGIIFLLGIIQYVRPNFYNNNLYNTMKKNTFGVYLFHPMIIYVLFYFWKNSTLNPILLCSIIILSSYLLSHIITNFIRTIKLGIIIGE